MITDRINNNLSALFDVNDDPLYKALISDKNGTIPATITKPTDIDIGVIASQIEYLRQLSINLVKQMYIDQAQTDFLEFVLNNYFSSLKLQDETDAQWVQRTIATVFNQKVSRAAIIFLLRPFSSQEPEITDVSLENALADFSYADIYESGETELDGKTIYYFTAVAESFESAFFTIKIILYDTPSTEIVTVQDIIHKITAAGITTILQITYTGA